MMSRVQCEALGVLQELCDLSEDIRLGQLMSHLGFLGEIATGRTLWDIEDEELLPVLYQHRAELIARLAPPAGVLPAPSTEALTHPQDASN